MPAAWSRRQIGGSAMAFNTIVYIAAGTALVVSFLKDPTKTRAALVKSKNAFLNLLPDFAAILALVGILLAFLSPALIARVAGEASGIWGMLAASVVGSITLIPGFVAFPLARSMLQLGAGVMQVGVFISTLMMVGFVTIPIERRYFGARETLLRNSMAYLYSFVVALVLGVIVR